MNSQNNAPSAGDLLARIKAARTALILAALGFAPLLGLFCVMSWSRPAYQFFPLAFAAAAALLWRALHSEVSSPVVSGPSESGPVVRSPVVLSLAVSSALLFLVANVLWSPWVGYVAFLLGLAAILWRFGGKSLLLAGMPAILILLTILPPPFNGEVTLTLWLRSVAVNTSNCLLDWLQVTHAQDGNTLLLPGRTLLVEEACSGINSFILCNFLCLFWGFWQRRRPWWFLFALPATSLFVVLGNVIRITAGATADYFWHFNLLSGRPHELFGLVLLLGYCVLILSFDQCLVFLSYSSRSSTTSPSAPPSPSTASNESFRPKPQFAPSKFKFGSGFLALVGIGFLSMHLFFGGRHGLAKLPSLSSGKELKFSLPNRISGWDRLGADAGAGNLTWLQTMGVHSIQWDFQHNGLQATVAVDYPLDGFHNVKICYLNSGWQELAEQPLLHPQSGEDLHAIKLVLQNATQHAVVWHSVVNEQGEWLAPPKSVANRLAATAGPPQAGYRIQMITAGFGPVSPAAEADCQAFFLQVRQALRQQLIEQFGKAAAK